MNEDKVRNIIDNLKPMKQLQKKYNIIVADPPWEVNKIQRESRPNQVNMDYPMMSLKQIKELPIESIADDKCILFLWTIDKYLFDTKAILDAWGFKYHLTMSWNKGNGMSMFGFHRITEFILVGLKGKHDAYPSRKTIPTSFNEKSPRHSAKPDSFYTMLDVLEGNRIDIFARKHRDDLFGKKWDIWGNEVENDIELITKEG